MREFITENSKQTQKLGELLAEEIIKSSTLKRKRLNLKKSFVICLSGDLGAGKTTFAQGFLKGLKVKGPYTSPTFVVLKHYKSRIKNDELRIKQKKSIIHNSRFIIHDIYHMDAYRVGVRDVLNLGWEEIVAEKNNIVIIEWADRIKKIIPRRALWIKFQWRDENKRKMELS